VVPTQATAVVDFSGARWTLYADDHNNVLRSINHETGAVWSFNYDPNDQLIAVEHPDLARTCLVHDAAGNITRRIEMPAVVSGIPTPDPIKLLASSHVMVEGFTPVLDIEPALPGERAIEIDGGLPDFTGLTLAEAIDAADEAGVVLKPIGTGIATMQDHPPGAIEPGTNVQVLFEPPK
jgi:YD repeat-containing protein